jgi:hypothetical protein
MVNTMNDTMETTNNITMDNEEKNGSNLSQNNELALLWQNLSYSLTPYFGNKRNLKTILHQLNGIK